MTRLTPIIRLVGVVLIASGSVAALAYVGLPYAPLRLSAMRLSSYLYAEEMFLRADFEAQPTAGIAPLAVALTNTSTGNYVSSLWDFGDGLTSSLDNPVHIYVQGGTYTVTLTVSGPAGEDTLTRPEYIRVYEPVIAGFGANPLDGGAPLKVHFFNESSGDYDTCLWDFGDGNTDVSCQGVNHTYETPGLNSVSLTVSGPGGEDQLVQTDLIAVYEPLVSNFVGEPTELIGFGIVEFTNLSTGDFDTCEWRFGDGTTSYQCDDPYHFYARKGKYTVSLTVSGPSGSDRLTRPQYIAVYKQVKVQFDALPVSGALPLDVGFMNQSEGDYDTCTWDFGDGHGANQCGDVNHTYESPGQFTVSLQVKGGGGADGIERKNLIEAMYYTYLPLVSR